MVRLWDATTGKITATLAALPLTGFVNAVAFSPDGKTLGTTSSPAAQLWNVR